MSRPSVSPTLDELAAHVVEQAARTELLVLDVDGVLTDGRLYYGCQGEMMKAVDARDGHGIVLLRQAGVPTAVLSGRPQPLLGERFSELRVAHVEERCFSKGEAIGIIAAKLGVEIDRVCFVGDDVVDLDALEKVGFPCCPADAATEVLARSLFVSSREGGRGAVREIAELILKAKNRWPGG